MDSELTVTNNIVTESPAESAESYERLRTWYLAHLRATQLANDIASGVTPATLVKRDRDALEHTGAASMDGASQDKVETTNSEKSAKRPKLKPSSLIVVVNVIVAVWLVTGIGNPVTGEFPPRLAIAILLVLSSVIIRGLVIDASKAKLELAAVWLREQNLADYALEPFWSMDANFNFVAANPAFERLTGGLTYVPLGSSFLATVPPDERASLESHLARVKKAQKSEKFETQIARVDGSVVDIELTAEYSDHDSSFYCVANNVTDRRQLERLKEQLKS